MNGMIDCPDLLNNIDFVVPRGTRSRTVFRRRFEPTYYAYNSGISRLLRLGCEAASYADFFGVPVTHFKNRVMKELVKPSNI